VRHSVPTGSDRDHIPVSTMRTGSRTMLASVASENLGQSQPFVMQMWNSIFKECDLDGCLQTQESFGNDSRNCAKDITHWNNKRILVPYGFCARACRVAIAGGLSWSFKDTVPDSLPDRKLWERGRSRSLVWPERSRDKSSLPGRRGGHRSRGVYRLDARIGRASRDVDRVFPRRSCQYFGADVSNFYVTWVT